MVSYQGGHAGLYDAFYREKPYAQEAAFIHRLIKKYSPKKAGKTLLEIAGGTGSHAFELERLGYQILSSDSSPDMVEQARRKARAKRSTIDFRVIDMRRIPPLAQSFDTAICLFDSIGYTITNEAILKTLTGVWRQLKPGGLFILEFWHGAAMVKSYSPQRVRRLKHGRTEVVRVSDTILDVATQTATVDYSIFTLQNGKFEQLKEKQKNRFFFVQEMDLFLTTAGFEALQFFAGYSETEPITDDTWHVVAVARKIGEQS